MYREPNPAYQLSYRARQRAGTGQKDERHPRHQISRMHLYAFQPQITAVADRAVLHEGSLVGTVSFGEEPPSLEKRKLTQMRPYYRTSQQTTNFVGIGDPMSHIVVHVLGTGL